MSRLEKAREEKKRRKKNRYFLLSIVALIMISAAVYHYVLPGYLITVKEQTGSAIDMERSSALIDVFGLTYVRIYLLGDLSADELRANGADLEYCEKANRWETVLTVYERGNEISIEVVSNGRVIQEETLLVEDL